MKVFVKLDDETQMVLEVERYDTVLSVKDKIPDAEVLLRKEELILSTISSSWKFFMIEKVLRFDDQILEDFGVLADYQIENNDTLQLVIHHEGGLVECEQVWSLVFYNNYKKPEIITVFAVLPNGKRLALEVDRTLTVSLIEEEIPDSDLIPSARQIMRPMIPKMKTGVKINVYFKKNLYFNGQALLFGNIEDYNIKNNDVIQVEIDVSWEEDVNIDVHWEVDVSFDRKVTSMTSNSSFRSSKCAGCNCAVM